MFKTILVPVDLGEVEAARPAIDKAVEIARGNPESSIRLIYVRPIVPVTYMEFMPPAFDEEQQADADTRLAELLAGGVDLPADRVSSVVGLGSVYNEVLNQADQIGADLIVVGSHQPSMATYLLGSNASAIVRHAKCSVLVVRA